MLNGKLVVVTRASEDSAQLRELLQKSGARVYELPTITFRPLAFDQKTIGDLPAYTHVLFSSSHAVDFFTEALPKNVEVIAIGTATQEKLTSRGVAAKLFSEVRSWQGANVLLPRSQLAREDLPNVLQSKGATVTTVVPYMTLYVDERDGKFEELLAGGHVDYLTFTSPSSIAGFVHRLAGSKLLPQARAVPVGCIGQTTVAAAKKVGFKQIFVAKQNTTASLVETLNQINDLP